MRTHILLIFLFFLFKVVNSQEKVSEYDKVEFIDGVVKEGKIKKNLKGEILTNNKLTFCDSKGQNCIKYSINEIDRLTVAPSQLIFKQLKELNSKNPGKRYKKLLEKNKDPNRLKIETYIEYYKVLLSPKKRSRNLYQLKYSGKSANFYSRAVTTNDLKLSTNIEVITKPSSIIIEYMYKSSGNNKKRDLEKLSEYFKDCSAFINESKKKNIHKKQDLNYFYKLSDECNL